MNRATDLSTYWIGMMITSDHKIRREMFHALEQVDDFIHMLPHQVKVNQTDTQLIESTILYFTTTMTVLSFPSKTYAVAIIYSMLLQQHFSVPFFESLNDADLFVGTDRFFVKYQLNTNVYDAVLEELKLRNINPLELTFSQVQSTIEYFNEEYYLIPNRYFNNK